MNRGIKPWCNHKILLANVFLVASAFPLLGQEASVTPPRKKLPELHPNQAPLGAQEGTVMPPHVKRPPNTAPLDTARPLAPKPPPYTGPLDTARPFAPKRPLVRVPNVVGLATERMFTALSRARLVGRLADKKMSNYRFGKITRQKPPAGTMVKSGSTVIVWVSDSRSNPPPTRPPNRSGGHSPWDLKSFLLGIILAFIAAKLFRRRQKHQSPFELRPVLDPGAQVLVKVGPLVKGE